MASDNTFFELEIVTPDQMFYDGNVQMVEFNTSDGRIGVLKDHSSVTTIVAPGEFTISIGAEKKQGSLQGGFAEILSTRVRILAEGAQWAKEKTN